jgi:hypothetical protein
VVVLCYIHTLHSTHGRSDVHTICTYLRIQHPTTVNLQQQILQRWIDRLLAFHPCCGRVSLVSRERDTPNVASNRNAYVREIYAGGACMPLQKIYRRTSSKSILLTCKASEYPSNTSEAPVSTEPLCPAVDGRLPPLHSHPSAVVPYIITMHLTPCPLLRPTSTVEFRVDRIYTKRCRTKPI